MNDTEGTPERKCSTIEWSGRSVRQGWAEAAQDMARRGDDVLLDPPTATTFDEVEWTW